LKPAYNSPKSLKKEGATPSRKDSSKDWLSTGAKSKPREKMKPEKKQSR